MLTVDRYSTAPVDCPTFLYAPCCPHELYDAILEANWSPEGAAAQAPAHLAPSIDSVWPEKEARLTQPPADAASSGEPSGVPAAPPAAPQAQHSTGDSSSLFKLVVWGTSFQSQGAGASLMAALMSGGRPSPTGAGLGSGSLGPFGQTGGQMMPLGQAMQGMGLPGMGAPGRPRLGRLSSLVSKGGVLELFGPDFAAHGIATSLHLFPPNKLAASGLFAPPSYLCNIF